MSIDTENETTKTGDATLTNSEQAAVTDTDSSAVPEESGIQVEENSLPVIRQLLVAFGILAFIFGATLIPNLGQHETHEPEPQTTATSIEQATGHADAFADISLSARAAYVWDVSRQRALYNKNAGTELPLASLTKLMTALVAYQNIGTETITITPKAIAQYGDDGFTDGEQFTFRNLLDLTLAASSNDGAFALAAAAGAKLAGDALSPEKAFVREMNLQAAEIGLATTHFQNPTGLDTSPAESGGYGSARDVAFLMEYIVAHYPDLLEGTRNVGNTIASARGNIHTATNTNEIIYDIPGLIGGKTGYTDLAGGNLVVAYNAGLNRPVIITVLGSTREGRFDDMLTLIERTNRTLAEEH